MLRLIWVPKKYKNFSFKKVAEEAERILREVKERDKESARIYADLLIRQNKIANLTGADARRNLEILIPWIESEFPELNENS